MTTQDSRPAAAERLDAQKIGILLSAAAAAPSMHNAQPWRFRIRGHTVEVWADPARRLGPLDPDDRNLHIGVGAAVLNLRVAAEHLEIEPTWRLRPNPGQPLLLAEVHLGRHDGPGALAGLYDAVAQRHTNRNPYTGQALPQALITDLVAAAAAEGAWLRVFDHRAEVTRVVGLLRAAELAAQRDAERAAMLARWVGGNRVTEGIPQQALGPHPVEPATPFRDFLPGERHRPTAAFETTPTLAMLSTSRDRPVDWLRAGQGLERALLAATKAGVSASFLNQPIEDRQLRWQLRSPFEGIRIAQMVLRLGYGPPAAPTPRRPLDEMVELTEAP
jgi:hypothetical protein